MNFLIDLWKKAVKGDAFRTTDNPVTYNDKIAQLNSTGANQATKLTTTRIQKISKTRSQLTSTVSNTTLPGTR